MIGSKAQHRGLLAVIFALVVAVGLPTLVNAQGRGRGRGQDKKADKFINGHDARDGRWDGRGPKRGRDDRFDDDDRDDDYYRRNRRRDRDDDYGYGRRNRGDIDRIAESNGYRAGLRAGSTDRAYGDRFNYRDEAAYRDATSGYHNSYGDINFYRNNYREGFRRGYEDGYRRNGSRGGILGRILGRP